MIVVRRLQLFEFINKVTDQILVDTDGLLFHGGCEVLHAVVNVCRVELRDVVDQVAIWFDLVAFQDLALPMGPELIKFLEHDLMLTGNLLLKGVAIHLLNQLMEKN